MEKKLQALMMGLGWMLVNVGGEGLEWRKFDKGGAPLAVVGDQIWLRDIAACEVSLKVKAHNKSENFKATLIKKSDIIENTDIVRVIRILEYVGPREWIEHCLEHRAVKEIFRIQNNAYISEAFLQRVPESVILEELGIDVDVNASDKP